MNIQGAVKYNFNFFYLHIISNCEPKCFLFNLARFTMQCSVFEKENKLWFADVLCVWANSTRFCRCSVCLIQFNTEENLRIHMNDHHSRPGQGLALLTINFIATFTTRIILMTFKIMLIMTFKIVKMKKNNFAHHPIPITRVRVLDRKNALLILDIIVFNIYDI